MVRYVAFRGLGILPTTLLLIFVVVLLVRIIPGNVLDAAVSSQGGRLSQAERSKIESKLGLDKPVWAQYVDYVGGLARGSLGNSLWSRQAVAAIIRSRLAVTVQLALLALLLATLVAVPAGIMAGMLANSAPDYLARIIAVAGLSAPSFVVATYVLLVPTIFWGWSVPLYAGNEKGQWAHYHSLLVPAAILAFEMAASLTRVTRTAVLEVRRQDYVRTAQAKGLRGGVVVRRHLLRNALIPVISVAGIQIAALFSGVVIIEQIFGIPGLGSLTVSAFSTRDYTLVQGITLVLGVIVFLVNIGVDISYPLIDPRIRL